MKYIQLITIQLSRQAQQIIITLKRLGDEGVQRHQDLEPFPENQVLDPKDFRHPIGDMWMRYKFQIQNKDFENHIFIQIYRGISKNLLELDYY